jgi:hypothetical protein
MEFWQLLCVTWRQTNLDGLRFDDHAIDVALDQVAIHPLDRKRQRSKVRADTVPSYSTSGAGMRATLPASCFRFCKSAWET